MIKRREKDEQKLVQIFGFLLQKNKELLWNNLIYVEQNKELKSYIPALLEKIDYLSQDTEIKDEKISILGQELEKAEYWLQELESENFELNRMVDKFKDASWCDISDLEKSYLGEEDKSNFSFKGGEDKDLAYEELKQDL